MKKALDIYNHYREAGIDPFRKFTGAEYEILIPLSGLENFRYAPAYGEEYRAMGILDMTYSVNPTMYAAMHILNKLARERQVKFLVREAWRPAEVQQAKYEANLHATYKEWLGKVIKDLDFDEWVRNYSPDNWSGLKRFGLERSPTKFLAPKGGVGLPHVAGGAVDLLIADGWGNPLPQPKWLARKDPSLLDFVAPLGKGFENVANPLETPHIMLRDGAVPAGLALAVQNVGYMSEMARSVANLRHINDENWHFQLSDEDREYLVSYKNISIADARNTSAGHVARIKKEMTDFAEKIYGIFYERNFARGVKHNFCDRDFNPASTMTLDELRARLDSYLCEQRRILQGNSR
ncbi:MAG: hypothetical protein LBO78_00325 [Rickettsiales bacterium]|jgi:D-alanyl-D-alanine dipeptidase|nr:hypothetical protein [Rickettsiales bacterium]